MPPKPKEYVVYDTHDNECVVFIGRVTDIAKYFNTSRGAISNNISKKTKRGGRYLIEKII